MFDIIIFIYIVITFRFDCYSDTIYPVRSKIREREHCSDSTAQTNIVADAPLVDLSTPVVEVVYTEHPSNLVNQ